MVLVAGLSLLGVAEHYFTEFWQHGKITIEIRLSQHDEAPQRAEGSSPNHKNRCAGNTALLLMTRSTKGLHLCSTDNSTDNVEQADS